MQNSDLWRIMNGHVTGFIMLCKDETWGTVNQNRELLNTFAGRFQAKQAEFHSFLKNNKKGEMNYE